MNLNATATYVTGDTTIPARFLLGLKSISGIMTAYSDVGAATNPLAQVPSGGAWDPSWPVVVPKEGNANHVRVTLVGTGFVYTSE